MSGEAVCPQCETVVEPHWEWCHECGFDPENNRPQAPAAAAFSVGPDAAHPYADLPYTHSDPEPVAAPAAPRRGSPSPVGPGLTPLGFAADTTFGPAPPRPAPGFSASGVPSAHGPGRAPPGYGYPIPGAAGAAPAKPNPSRVALVLGISVLVAAIVGIGLVKVAGSASTDAGPKPTTTRNPNSPPPMGAITPGGVPSDPAAPTTLSRVPASIPVPTDGWLTYRAPDGTFQCEFPAQWKTESDYFPAPGQQLAALNVYYEVGVDGGGYSVLFVDLPSAATFNDSRSAFEDINKGKRSRSLPVLNDTGDIPVDGHTAVSYTIDSEGRVTRGALIVTGARYYEISALGVDDVSFNRFLASFHVLRNV